MFPFSFLQIIFVIHDSFAALLTIILHLHAHRFGENAGEATEDVLATAGHCAGTAWNIIKIRRAINPASSVSTGILRNAVKEKK